MFKRLRRIQHTQESSRLFEFTVKSFCDLARNSRQNSSLDDAMKAHLLKIVEQIGIPEYEEGFELDDAEFEELPEVEVVEETEPPKERGVILVHDKRRKMVREIER